MSNLMYAHFLLNPSESFRIDDWIRLNVQKIWLLAWPIFKEEQNKSKGH